MEFEELQQIWDAQNDRPLYAINEKALHDRILSKKSQARHITNTSELVLILVNTGSGGIILGMGFPWRGGGIYMYLLAAWMLGSAIFVLASRVIRIGKNNQFDRSMLGDLDHAISVATYQVHLSRIMRWNILTIAILVFLGLWQGGKPLWTGGLTFIFFVFAYYVSGWENKIYKARRRELQQLRTRLEH